MKLIDRLFPGFKHYHRVNLRHIIRRGYEDAEADDDRPNLEAARPESVAEAEPEPEPVYRPKFEALRAHYEAMVKAREEQRRREDEEYERLEEERRKQDERPDPADRRSEESRNRSPSRSPGRLRVQARSPHRPQPLGAQGHDEGPQPRLGLRHPTMTRSFMS